MDNSGAPLGSSSSRLEIPDNFKASCSNFNDYPKNLVNKTSFPAALDGFKQRLDSHASRLFSDRSSYVAFRDFTGDGLNGGLETTIIQDDLALQSWLGTQSLSSLPGGGGSAPKKDPKCRYMFPTADCSRSPLNLTQSMLASILTYHQVMPVLLDFLLVFGSAAGARELMVGGFREQTLLAKPPRGLVIEVLGRSGRQFQLCYNLKGAVNKSMPGTMAVDQEWSIRQAAIHHQFDVEYGTTLWIIIQVQAALKRRITEVTAIHGRPEDRAFPSPGDCFRTSLTTHLLNFHWVTEQCRWYVQWLEEVIEQETTRAIYSTRDEKGLFLYPIEDIQTVQHREDRLNNSIVFMEANTDTLQSLRSFYKRLTEDPNFDLRAECKDDIMIFISQLDDSTGDLKSQITHAKSLAKTMIDRKGLILQHLQTQVATDYAASDPYDGVCKLGGFQTVGWAC